MQRHLASLLLCLTLLSLPPAWAFAEESAATVMPSATIIPSVTMDAPQGYMEIEPNEFPDFARPLATEYSHMGNDLLRVFIKKEELLHMRNGDFDLLTGVVTASWHKSVEKRKDSAENARTHERVMRNIGPFLLLAERMDLKRFERIEEIFLNREALPAADRSGKSLPESRIRDWLREGPDVPDMELGCLETGPEHALFAWLQADTDFLDFGIMARKPLAVALALVEVEGKILCLTAASSFTTATEASVPVELLSAYLTAETHSFKRTRGTRIERRTDCFNLLFSSALFWREQGRTEKAAEAYRRLIHFWGKARQPDAVLHTARGLGLMYFQQERHADLIRELPPVLAQWQAVMADDHPTVIMIKEMLGFAYRSTNQLAEAEKIYEEALASALRVYGPIDENTIGIALELSTTLALARKFERAFSLSEEAFAGAVELYAPGDVAGYAFRIFTNLASSGKPGPAEFYVKLAAGLVRYNDNSGPEKVAIDAYTQEGVLYLMSGHLKRLGKAATPEAFREFWQRPNESSDTPWNKGRELMRGEEVALYERFGQVAEALHRAGESGSEQEKEKARADFNAWMDAVNEAFP